MAITQEQLRTLTKRHHLRVLGIRSQFVGQILRLWNDIQPIGDAEAEQFTSRAVSALLGAQTSVSNLTSGYLALATGLRGPSKPIIGADLRNGADPFEVYMRGIVTVRKQLSDGVPPPEALAIGRERTAGTAATDVMLAQRAQMDAWAEAEKVTAYRRVLTGASCDLCRVASTQRYWKGNLMPIHGHCDCGVEPILVEKTTRMRNGRPYRPRGDNVLDHELLDQLKQEGVLRDLAQQRQRKAYRERIPNAEHHLKIAQDRVEALRAELKAGIPDMERETRVEKRLDEWRSRVAEREQRLALLKGELKATGPEIHTHGELGPVLTSAGDNFTGPSDL